MVFKLGCSQSRDLLNEFYFMLRQKRVKYPKICSKLGIHENMKDTFIEMIYLLFYIMSYDFLDSSQLNQLITIRIKTMISLADITDEDGKDLDYLGFSEFKKL